MTFAKGRGHAAWPAACSDRPISFRTIERGKPTGSYFPCAIIGPKTRYAPESKTVSVTIFTNSLGFKPVFRQRPQLRPGFQSWQTGENYFLLSPGSPVLPEVPARRSFLRVLRTR